MRLLVRREPWRTKLASGHLTGPQRFHTFHADDQHLTKEKAGERERRLKDGYAHDGKQGRGESKMDGCVNNGRQGAG